MKRGDNASLADGNTLLLHGFMNRSTILVIHLVKFINETHSAVSQDKCAAFQSPFARDRVL